MGDVIISNRWLILAVLFFARTAMAFQFQSVGALSPLIIEEYGISLADIGLLIGLYLAPGVVVAIPGGAIAGRFGDKRIVGLSMVLMLIGSALISWGAGWESLISGRLIAGIGGVALNVVMTKMVVDWFVGREISTAMGIFINSWPVGIALALLTLPRVAASGGLELAWILVLTTTAISLALFLVFYSSPEEAPVAPTSIKLKKLPLYALLLAGSVWAFYNTALAMVFSFGPALLSERGLPLTSASSMTSLFMVVIAVSIPIGGFVADRTGRPNTVIMISLLSYIVLVPMILFLPVATVPASFLIVGFFFGLGAGPIISLPSTVLLPPVRAFGMGVYYTFYYAAMMAAPPLAGALADKVGSVGIVFVLGAALIVASMVTLGGFKRVSSASPLD
ncbi:CynX/NimT family MFS transporter [Falsihalocynthiibacter sp. S25ZX9]|uniref:MFS transporter n=1 Tax=Falsihalocynthiibacter sp. S25ZX9 TaxID=3240870 RepID=UPI003510C807